MERVRSIIIVVIVVVVIIIFIIIIIIKREKFKSTYLAPLPEGVPLTLRP